MNELKKEEPSLEEFEKSGKSFEEVKIEQDSLTNILKDLKKENLSLQTSVTAWQVVLGKKAEECRKIEANLNTTYLEIWSERENFCTKSDKFNQEYGILSDWWISQIGFISNTETWKRKKNERNKEIQKLHEEIKELKKELEELEKGQMNENVAACLLEDEVSRIWQKPSKAIEVETSVKDDESSEKVVSEKSVSAADYGNFWPKEQLPPTNQLFTIMDVDKIRQAKRRKSIRK